MFTAFFVTMNFLPNASILELLSKIKKFCHPINENDHHFVHTVIKSSTPLILVIDKWRKFCTHVSVEPAMIIFYTTYIIMDFINTNLYIQKNCRNDTSSEPDLSTRCDDEKRGILFVTNFNYYFRYFLVASMVIHTILSSCWSDRAGRRRKPFILMPIFGQIFELISLCVQSYFWSCSASWSLASHFIFQVLSGGNVLLLNSCITYITDTSSLEDRTMKMSILFALQVVCTPIGNGVSGYLLRSAGFFYSYIVCLIATIISLILGLWLIKDISYPVEKKPTILSFFSLTEVINSVKMMFRKTLGHNRPIVMTLLILHVTVFFSMSGQKSVFYLYFRYRFKWDERFYSMYVMCKLIGLTFGTFFCSLVLSKHFKIHDGIIGSFASFWDTMANVAYTFAYQNWQLYLIPILDIFHGAAISVHYSFISKYFKEDEYGRLTSALNVFSLFVPLSHPIFSSLFAKTMDTFPSAFFVLGGISDFITLLLYAFTYYLCRKVESRKKSNGE